MTHPPAEQPTRDEDVQRFERWIARPISDAEAAFADRCDDGENVHYAVGFIGGLLSERERTREMVAKITRELNKRRTPSMRQEPDFHWDSATSKYLFWFFIITMAIVILAAWLTFGGQTVEAQTGPILRYDNTLRIWIGPAPHDARVVVDTTWSTSPNADIGPPFDEVGENPQRWYLVNNVRVLAPGDKCREVEPKVPCRDTGWIDLPVPDVKVETTLGSGVWVLDEEMRIVVHVTASELGLCGVVACGSRLVVPRVRLSQVMLAPVVVRRRAVVK